MSKTLVVSYLPNAYSVTKKVLDQFLASAKAKTTVVDRDLLKQNAPIFDATSMAAYQMRGFMGKTLEGVHAEAIKPFDVLIDEVAAADRIVFAFPTHNWSEPAAVKAWVDAVLQYGRTIRFTATGASEGVFTGKKALVLFASGGIYDEGNPRRTIQNAFTFYLNAIGITDITFAPIGGTLMGDEQTAKSVAAANSVVDATVKAWY